MSEQFSFGAWVRRRRKALDLTRDELAPRVGCAVVTIRRIEADERRPSKLLATRLADALELAPEERQAFLKAARAELTVNQLASVVPAHPAIIPARQQPDRPRTNLPAPLTPLIGREREIAQVVTLHHRPGVRLLTLTGPGGVGKTRLALQVAATVRDDFTDGVCFVDLAPTGDPALVAGAIAEALELAEVAGQPRIVGLKRYLEDKHALLLLDNFEHLVAAAPVVTELLTAAPQLTMLVTSRTTLHLSGEHEVVVPPLTLPDPSQLPPADQLHQYAAVALFYARAQAIQGNFQLTAANARAVAEICCRLDGLPLAIELAAARSKLFAPLALLERLSSRLGFLTSGARDVPKRQQTLRQTLDWSCHLLNAGEQMLFRRLAVFVGGWTLEAAEQVCNAAGDLPIAVADGVASLLDQSLLRQEAEPDATPRFTMLETIREYALGQLEASGEARALRQRHAQYFLVLAERSETKLEGAEGEVWLFHLRAEHANLRAALATAQAQAQPELGLRLAGALWRFWHIHGDWTEAGYWLNIFLRQTGAGQPDQRAKALGAAGRLALDQGDLVRSTVLLEESVALWTQLGDRWGIVRALNDLAWVALHRGDHSRARRLLEDKLQLCRDLGSMDGVARSLQHLGLVALEQRDDEQALRLLEESSQLMRTLAERRGLAWCLEKVGLVAFYRGEYARAHALFGEALAIFRQLDERTGIAALLARLARSALHQGEYANAQELLWESLQQFVQLGDKRNIIACLEVTAVLAAVRGHSVRAARLWGAAESLRATADMPVSPSDRSHDAPYLTALHERLDDVSFAAAWTEGQALSLDQAIAVAREEALHLERLKGAL
jgi:predicted ATPase/transcriptional regulator with XRE-family HTH domain